MSIRGQIASLIHALADSIGGLDNQAERETLARALTKLGRIKEGADAKLEAYEIEVQRRKQLELLDERPPDHWRSFYYVRQAFRILTDDAATQGHWRGGQPQHDNAICPHCRKPLLLFYDINLRDPHLQRHCPELSGEIARLPLYYCCRRPEPTVYQLLTDGNLRMITPELAGGETSPFSGFPDSWERSPVRLEAIPRDVENLRAIADAFGASWLHEEEESRIREYISNPKSYSIMLSQFGGSLITHQGRRELDCPNKLCLTHQMGDPLLRNRSLYQMKQLAVISDDAQFEMKTYCAQIVFHICWKCHTIQADYQCD